jgi:hypothetical protein
MNRGVIECGAQHEPPVERRAERADRLLEATTRPHAHERLLVVRLLLLRSSRSSGCAPVDRKRSSSS